MEDSMNTFALQWYTQMQSGELDRTQLNAAYSAHLTDEAVQQMSRCLDEYGASPKGAEIMQSRTLGDQTFHLVKILFPRCDAASLLFGCDTAGKISTDWFSTRRAADASKACCIPENHRGGREADSYDQCNPSVRIARKVVKRGSHLCAPNYCRRYRPAARHAQAIDTSMSHLVFRCVLRS
jgi:hypothetical protein